jgi:hypothetical protein
MVDRHTGQANPVRHLAPPASGGFEALRFLANGFDQNFQSIPECGWPFTGSFRG